MMDNKSRMKGDFHVRFCEKLGLKCPCLLDSSLIALVLKAETPGVSKQEHHLYEQGLHTFLFLLHKTKHLNIYTL